MYPLKYSTNFWLRSLLNLYVTRILEKPSEQSELILRTSNQVSWEEEEVAGLVGALSTLPALIIISELTSLTLAQCALKEPSDMDIWKWTAWLSVSPPDPAGLNETLNSSQAWHVWMLPEDQSPLPEASWLALPSAMLLVGDKNRLTTLALEVTHMLGWTITLLCRIGQQTLTELRINRFR